MESDILQNLLVFLKDVLEKNEFGSDEQKILYLYNELEKFKTNLPTIEKLEELQKIEVDLEVKYDNCNELSYYFNPLYVQIKKKINDENIKKIREENKKKNGIK